MFGIGGNGTENLVFLFLVFLYFVPSIVATWRKHSKATSIRILNILAGWTFIGWIIAAVWAYSENNRVGVGNETKDFESGKMKKCPYCAELVKREAIVCKHCGKDLPEEKKVERTA